MFFCHVNDYSIGRKRDLAAGFSYWVQRHGALSAATVGFNSG